jgi:pimeloyl-ACP methyl ester carboxylesterase
MGGTTWRREVVAAGVEVLSRGAGPGVVVIPATNQRADRYESLARGLSGAHAVHVIERRGRGVSGARGPEYGVESEVDDVVAVLEQTRARMVFGHGYGGLVALHVGLRWPVDALIAYEPTVSVGGSFDASWLTTFTRQLAAREPAAAMATYLKGMEPAKRLLWATALRMVRRHEARNLLSTVPAEVAEIVRLDSDGSRYGEIASRTLLLGGEQSPAYLTGVLPMLAQVLPSADYAILPGLDHHAPDRNAPDEIAQQIRLHLVRAERRASRIHEGTVL